MENMEEAQREAQRKMEKEKRERRKAFLRKAAAEGFNPDLFPDLTSSESAKDKANHGQTAEGSSLPLPFSQPPGSIPTSAVATGDLTRLLGSQKLRSSIPTSSAPFRFW